MAGRSEPLVAVQELDVYKYYTGSTFMKITDFAEAIEIAETASAGASGAGSMGAVGNGFAGGGPGTLDRPGGKVTGVRTGKKRKPVSETHVPGHLDHEVRMARAETLNLAQNSVELYKMLKDQGESAGLPGWISAYITLSNDYTESVFQYMRERKMEQAAGEHHQF